LLFEIYNLSSLDISTDTWAHGRIGDYALAIHTAMDEPSIIIKQGDYYFYCLDGKYHLFLYTGNNTALILPENINGCSYSIIGSAFSTNADVISITIPKAVTSISPNAFLSWSKLTEAFFEVTTGWKRNGVNSSDPTTVYESSYLEDPKNAADALNNASGTGRPMYRTE
jgi:hypothetical protein